MPLAIGEDALGGEELEYLPGTATIAFLPLLGVTGCRGFFFHEKTTVLHSSLGFVGFRVVDCAGREADCWTESFSGKV